MRRTTGPRSHGRALLALACGLLAILALPSLAAAKDRNRDRIPDRWEKRHHLSLHVNQAHRDQDRDGLDNRGEFRAGDNPRKADSDEDGVMDGEENAGTVVSFDSETGKLVIALFGGETVSGVVTDETEIHCGHACGEGSSASSSRRRENQDATGPASGPPGQGDDENDDPPGHDGTPPGASEGPGRGHAEDEASCTSASLVAGAIVKEASLEVKDGVATFEEIELAR